MKAMVQRAYGPADQVLELCDIDEPTVGDHDVLVRVRAASIHADVWHVITGLPYVLRLMGAGLYRPRNPIPGTDMAGVVESVGKAVTRFAPGDAVFGETVAGHQWSHGGAFAELVAVNEHALERKPNAITFEQAATIPTSGLIAQMNLSAAGIRAGHKVVIKGAGGGVGTIALQLAKAHGAQVTGVDSGDKLQMLQSIGADHVIDYALEDFTQGAERYDLILDVASNLSLADAKRVLTPTGKYILIGHAHYQEDRQRWFGNLAHFFALLARSPFDRHLPDLAVSTSHDGLAGLAELIEVGKLTPVVDRTFPLREVPEAIAYLKAGRVRGKVVVTPPGFTATTPLTRGS